MNNQPNLPHISEPLRDILKEVIRRPELRSRLEIEIGEHLSDDEFIAIADRTGMRL
jgi:hypothetical protein